jgi:leucyl-tRNA---protein transferase
METIFRHTAAPSPCGYLPDRMWSLEYELVYQLNRDEYMQRMREGWRRFGTMLFRPHCAGCHACQSLRVLVDRFRPDRGQRRARKCNEGVVEVRVGTPSVTRAKLQLYDLYHHYQSENRGWPEHPAKDTASYAQSFVDNPFVTQEWCYYLEGKLVGVGYVDDLPAGLSAIYFYYDPAERRRSLGTWNVLSILDEATRRGLPHVYLGYYVEGCLSMMYKARFGPNQILGADGAWHDFRTRGESGE